MIVHRAGLNGRAACAAEGGNLSTSGSPAAITCPACREWTKPGPSDHPKRYRVSFTGRQVGAIGAMSERSVDVWAHDESDALLKVYDTHEHILAPTFQVLGR